MKKYSFVIDVAKCENCNNCFLSCKDEHCGNAWPGYSLAQPLHGQRWMNIARKERGNFPQIDVAYLPRPCMHCDNAPCIRAGRDGAVYKREDGIVIIDPEKAKGQRAIVHACPFEAVWWNEEAQVPQKCTFCAHLLDQGWKETRCVQSCPTGALSILYVEEEEMEDVIAREKLEFLDAMDGTVRPRCFYKNLYRYNRCFIAGSVASGDDTVSECAEGVTVQLLKGDLVVDEQKSDDFGDFKFDMLVPDGGVYSVAVVSQKGIKKKIDVKLEESISVGTMWI